ncbi:short chain dehydrogenase/reductase [Xylariaceae sp. FL0016]|nr:short chain dehydrogenase/reductase [Xylariaceae sp. FL0016]
MNSLLGACSVLGAGFGLYVSYKFLDAIFLYSLSSDLSPYLRPSSGGKPAWALVTGASDGIGRSLASELASRGLNVVLHGRNASKLEDVQAELSQSHPARSFRALVADASQVHTSAVDFAALARSLEHLHLTVLVNNVGRGPAPAFGALETYPASDILSVIHLNAAFPALLTAALLPLLHRNGPGLVVNVASITDQGLPLVSFYGAAKAFGHVLALALWREARLDRRDVRVISHRVGAVTGVSHVRDPGTLWRPDAATVARRIVGLSGCGRKSVVPYWPHALQQLMLSLLPEWVADRVLMGVMRDERTNQDAEGKGKEE